jgi:nucleoside-diphosphate-sugar epimerase
MMMKTCLPNVAVIGSNGFVGSQICKAIENNQNFNLIRIVRGDNINKLCDKADMVIHAANSAGRFIAESNPQNDFVETVEKTFNILRAINGKPLLLLSTLSCKTQMDINYGRNRRSCELLVLSQEGKVVRLGPMFGGDRKKDTLHDLLAGRNVYVAPETRYAYADVSWVASKIVELLSSPSGLYEIGANNAVPLSELRDYFNSKSIFSGINDTQIPEYCEGAPDARLVFDYAEKELKDTQP